MSNQIDEDNIEEFQETLTSSTLEEGIENLEETMTFQDIYASLLLHDEIRITIPATELERVKVGMKNVKGKIATKNRDSGLPVDSSVLKFSAVPDEELEGHIVLTIVADRKGSVVVKKIEIPTDDL